MTDRCASPGCRETEGLEPMEGGEGVQCPSCRAEVQLLVATLREREIERDRLIEARRIES